jgi:hypothetical protein
MDENTVEVVPSRVLNYTYDEFTGLPSLAEIAIRAMPSPSPS